MDTALKPSPDASQPSEQTREYIEQLDLELRSPDAKVRPAGGLDPERFDWHEAWYPVAFLKDLDPKQLTRFTLLEQDLVIWWDRQQETWRAFADRCPHRLVPLSEGRIEENGLLECPYHGWAFAGDGSCDRIPQQNDSGTAETSKRACVQTFATAERQGLLFVYRGNPEHAHQTRIPLIEPLEDEGTEDWVVLDTFRDLPYDALTLLENVLDASHIPYTHHKTVGNRANVSPLDLEVIESGKQGFKGYWPQGPRRGNLGPQGTVFLAPGLMWHDLTSKQFGRTITAVYATPIAKGRCRLFARFPFKFASKLPALFIKLTPQWYAHVGNNGVLEDDQIFLHHQERNLAAAGGSAKFARAFYLPTKADAYVMELQNWVNQFAADPFPGAALPPVLPREQLLDRYHSHTKHCKSCRGALAGIRRLRWGLAIAAILSWFAVPLLALQFGQDVRNVLVPTGLGLLSCAGWAWLGTWERKFYEGRSIPPRNLPEKKK